MKHKNLWIEFLMTFMIVTACVTILEGVMGTIFMSDQKIGFGAFFSPPLFGLISSILDIVNYSSKELTIKQTLVRKVIHLILIEAAVFGLNAWAGNFYEGKVNVAIIISVAITYITVHVVSWVNDQKSAKKFNERLKIFQEKIAAESKEENNGKM